MNPSTNPSLTMLSAETLLEILSYLPLRSRVNLSSTCRQLHNLTYNSPRLWKDILFPKNDYKITDEVVASLVPKIVRCDAVKELKLDGLSLTESGVLELLDHFGHSIEHLELSFNHDTSLVMEKQLISRFSAHLEVFVLTLGLHQKFDNMPPTFMEYRENDASYLHQTHHLLYGYPKVNVEDFVRHFSAHGLPTQLDDPPLPQLRTVRILSDEVTLYTDQIKRLRVLLAYLAGQDLAKDVTLRTPVTIPEMTMSHSYHPTTTAGAIETRFENRNY
ncbi:hypothetical protein BC937DRAFT_88283 [Endogone sp. FLAS-F59071]|nr:hypothetical protein BC937DRAFT_88283 [Endogone sp. FLAS-F59071]|eukprot:RUS22603.1 hypothetical protein BC937DRAFT_88283 [Endogone sp. FLAS-F59071]